VAGVVAGRRHLIDQINAIEEKIKALGPLLDQKIKQAEDDLMKKLAAGEAIAELKKKACCRKIPGTQR